MKWRERIAWATIFLMTAGAAIESCQGTSAIAKSGGTVLCSANPCIVRSSVNGVDGLRVVGSQGPALDHPFVVTDWQGTPQFFVSVGQVATGDLPLCVTDPHYRMVGCLSPGTWDATKGQYTGPAFLMVGGVKLTAKDIAWIHAHGG